MCLGKVLLLGRVEVHDFSRFTNLSHVPPEDLHSQQPIQNSNLHITLKQVKTSVRTVFRRD